MLRRAKASVTADIHLQCSCKVLIGDDQTVHAKQAIWIGPDLFRSETGFGGEGVETVNAVLVGALGVDALALGEVEHLAG